jgi:hypothetical protein
VTVDTLKFLTKRFRFKSMILFVLMIAYIGFSLFLFFRWVAPSLDGRVDQHIAADSGTYIYFADSLRSGNVDPYVIASLASFPNNLWVPVLLALVLKSTFVMVIANYAMFFWALVLLKKSYSFSAGIFVGLLLLNATTTISLLSVNKEIVDLLALSMFVFARRRSSKKMLCLALLLALFNRFEVGMIMVLFLLVESKLNPWVQRRVMTLAALTILLNVMLPLLASNTLNTRFEEASSGGIVTWLDSLEMHYLYGVAVIPKIAENLFGELVNVSKWSTSYGFSDIANSYIVLSNNLATAIVFVILVMKRSFSLRSDLVYFAMLGCIIMAISLVIQPRYFYFAYALLCLQASRTEVRRSAGSPLLHKRDYRDFHSSLIDYKEEALG